MLVSIYEDDDDIIQPSVEAVQSAAPKSSPSVRAGFTQTRALFRKNVGAPRAPAGIFARGEPEGLGDGSPPAVSRGGAPVGVWGRRLAKPPEADGILLKMTYTDIVFCTLTSVTA